jgi:asparagine synthase (glutamine-hydrolysing)
MCGIFGVGFASAGDPSGLEAALEAIAHRGPDDARAYRDAGATLGFRRLAILDLTPAAAQPMVAADGSVAVVCNGEIYNHHALREELAGRGHSFRSRSDVEVVVEGYRAWGDAVVERLDGMFALAIWDARRRSLLLARDRAGKKPLFFARAGDGSVWFASEVKALLAGGVEAELDLSALPYLLSFGYTPAPWTLYRGVRQVPPATVVSFAAGGEPRARRYWRPSFTAPPLAVGVEEATAELRRLFLEAVARRLEADVPIGAFLSGGLDSTMVVGAMSRLRGPGVRTFSIGFAGDPRYDETHYARLVASAFATEHTAFTLEPPSLETLQALVALHDGPFGDSSAVPTSMVARLARRHVTVALSGDGGDELFCGYHRLVAAELAERVPHPLLRLAAAAAAALPAGAGERSRVARARRFLRAARLPLADRLARWSSLFAFELDALLRPEVRAAVRADAPLEWMRALVAGSAGASTLARILDHNFATYLPEDLLVKTDRCSMAHALEVRCPFLDTALMDYAARLPDSFKRRGLTTKWILRRGFADLLPPQIARRGKMGFGMPLAAWLRREMRPQLQETLGGSAALHAYLDPAFVARLVREHLEGRADHAHRLWLLLTLELWLRSLASRRRGAGRWRPAA